MPVDLVLFVHSMTYLATPFARSLVNATTTVLSIITYIEAIALMQSHSYTAARAVPCTKEANTTNASLASLSAGNAGCAT